jgi:hypothetical protein
MSMSERITSVRCKMFYLLHVRIDFTPPHIEGVPGEE